MSKDILTSLAEKLILEHDIKPIDAGAKGIDLFSTPSTFVGAKIQMTIYPIGLVKADKLSQKEIIEYADQFYEIARSLSFSDFLGKFDARRLTAKMGFLGFVFEDGIKQDLTNFIISQKRGTNTTFGSAFTACWVIDCKSLQVHTHAGYPAANKMGFYFTKNSLEAFVKTVISRETQDYEKADRAEQTKYNPGKTDLNQIKIFMSYRRSDSADVSGRIYDRLTGRFGKPAVFKDVDSIPLGVNFKEFLDTQVRACNVFLAIVGNQWLHAKTVDRKYRLEDPTDFVRIEIESALRRDIPIIPILVSGAAMPVAAVLPPSLRELAYRNGIQIRPDPDFHRDMDRLISALENMFAKGTRL